ncbi:MAG TPA: type II toxin-antitoxin system RelE/ParE family toxin [Xanthobacteraceae bacterium]|jgi:toxin ParE1/3/4
MPARVVFATSARADLDSLFEWIADRAGLATALAYTGRIERYCSGFTPFPKRGAGRDDLRPGLRTVGFERRVTIAFTIRDENVIILRILYAGRSLERAFENSEL